MSEPDDRHYVVREIHQMRHDGELYWLNITVTAAPSGVVATALAQPPFGIPADLGRKIADLIRAECGDPEAV